MLTKTKVALATVLVMAALSPAYADDGNNAYGASGVDWVRIHPDPTISRERAPARRSNTNAPTCPWLEGYPDCHLDAEGF